jgi:hypothetical protein
LQLSLGETIRLKCYLNQDGSSIFGPNPTLALRQGDEALARALVLLVRNAVDAAFSNKELSRPFDVLNEAFGHFVRDNFRSNIEDAQYLTPPEVVDLMVDIALEDMGSYLRGDQHKNPFIVVDPTCGVGSFLTMFYHKSRSLKLFEKRKLLLVGQDKVERMTRLTKINLALFEALDYQMTIGNSLAKDTPLAELNGSVDLILTNPPFGASFSGDQIASCGKENLPIFAPICAKITRANSELLFVDRDLSLLKDGGRLLIIVPDSVISARGIPALLRQQLRTRATVRGVIELPSVTFAQAGTRTKTCILYLVKGVSSEPKKSVFVATSNDLGFEVSSRKGVQVKVAKGRNDLPIILDAYRSSLIHKSDSQNKVISTSPSCVKVDYDEFVSNSWTPKHYDATRLRSIRRLRRSSSTEASPLSSLVDFQSECRPSESFSDGCVFISVLHVIGEGLLDIGGMMNYRPKTAGIRVKPGEIIFSKINPRIPRVLVVPNLGRKVLCSSEFEVMSTKQGVNPYLVAYLLLSEPVQSQVRSLTSGTSASHNRIRTNDLAGVLLPLPKRGTESAVKLNLFIEEYRRTIECLVEQACKLSRLREEEGNWPL